MGERVVTKGKLESTAGMIANPSNLDNRRASAAGEVLGPVPGHGGDVWWVRHDDGAVAPYCYTEYEREDSPGHGGAGQTTEEVVPMKGNSPASDVVSEREPGPADGVLSPAQADPWERILLPNGGVRYRRRRPPAPEPSDEPPPSTWLPPDASPPEPDEPMGKEAREEPLTDEDLAMIADIGARLFGGGGT